MTCHYIQGKWLEGKGMDFHSTNPATGETVWSGKSADSLQVEQAVAAAKGAFKHWSSTRIDDRVAVLEAFRSRLEARKHALATLISQETGKILWDATGEVAATIGKLNFALKAYQERTAERTTDMGGYHASLRHRPHGVMAVYGPYNFPAHLPNGHIMPALLAGNSVVFKPSELTPAVGAWMIEQWHEAGLPAGVLNLVQGEKEVGIALANTDIDGLLFTGSSATGALLHKQFAGRPEVLLALELGGNNPLVVHDIRHINAAVYETIQSAFISSGQRCTCARRLIVTDGPWAEPFLQRLAETTQNLHVGTYDDNPAPFMGPLVSSAEAARLLDAHDALLDQGGLSLARMKRLHEHRPSSPMPYVRITFRPVAICALAAVRVSRERISFDTRNCCRMVFPC